MDKDQLCEILQKKADEFRDKLLKLPMADTYRGGYDVGYHLAYAHALEFAVSVLMGEPIEPSEPGESK